MKKGHSTIDKTAAARLKAERVRKRDVIGTADIVPDDNAPSAVAVEQFTMPRPTPLSGRAEAIEKKYLEFALLAARRADALRGGRVLAFDLRGVVDYTDFALVMTANSPTHARGLGRDLEIALREAGAPNPVVHGHGGGGGWSVWDYGDLVVHVLEETAREHYQLERLWAAGTLMDWTPPKKAVKKSTPKSTRKTVDANADSGASAFAPAVKKSTRKAPAAPRTPTAAAPAAPVRKATPKKSASPASPRKKTSPKSAE